MNKVVRRIGIGMTTVTVMVWGVFSPAALHASSATNPGSHAIFPANGQTPEQQQQDELAAYNWACEQSGWDPVKAQQAVMQQTSAAQQTAENSQGGAVRGAAKGAILGVAIGAAAGDAGKGAAIGAAAGGVGGKMRSNQTQQAAKESTEQSQAAYQQQFSNWDKFYVAALEGKGYTVK